MGKRGRARNLKSDSSGFECRIPPFSSVTLEKLKEKFSYSDPQIL